MVYDFGKTSLVDKVTGRFTIRNTGDEVLNIQPPKPSCGCTVAKLDPNTLKPGEKGTLAMWRGNERWLPRLPVKSIDATGAGDAFAAALGVALAEGRPFSDASAFANAAAALATTIIGAQAAMPSRDAVAALQRQWAI